MKKRFCILMSVVILMAGGSILYSQQIFKKANDIFERFIPPKNYERVKVAEDSFGAYLRSYPLKEYGSPVLLYNGEKKFNNVYVSVFDMPLLDVDLIQCADAVIKLRAEYLYSQKRYSEIKFHITNGMLVPFSKFAEGERVIVSGNKTDWKGGYKSGYSRAVFDEYLKFIYSYAGTYSLSQESKKKKISEIEPGDFFIYGGSPGHVVLVLDIAEQKSTGKKIMLLGQSYMPSQEFHILKSPESISPWYTIEDEILYTPEWTFKKGSLMEFEE
ncbi:MAG: DUF4846 domain-containing protein [Treponema sp.]|nr:DUF4846 domain-containing protein [Treponema sp.]